MARFDSAAAMAQPIGAFLQRLGPRPQQFLVMARIVGALGMNARCDRWVA
jgi:hypothetical protein